MTNEEKARAYDEALDWMRRVYPTLTGAAKEDAEHFFPALKESEDERIYNLICSSIKNEVPISSPRNKKLALAYLERKKKTGIRWFKSDNVKNPDKPYIDKAGMFYTTDGRMCYASEIEKQNTAERIKVEFIKFNNEFDNQVSRLLASVLNKEHDYTKDFVKYAAQSLLEFAKREQNPLTIESAHECLTQMNFTEWSEEDEENINTLIEVVHERMGLSEKRKQYYEKWLKSKSLRHQPNLEWTEEDKRKLNRIYEILGYAADDKGFLTSKRIIGDNEAVELQDFLKSLRPQPHCKPSEEQMEALERASTNEYLSARQFDILVSLYEQLKKLM